MQNISAVEIKTKQWFTKGVSWTLEQLGWWTQLIPELRTISYRPPPELKKIKRIEKSVAVGRQRFALPRNMRIQCGNAFCDHLPTHFF